MLPHNNAQITHQLVRMLNKALKLYVVEWFTQSLLVALEQHPLCPPQHPIIPQWHICR